MHGGASDGPALRKAASASGKRSGNTASDPKNRTALMTNFRHKLDSKEDIVNEGVVGLFCSAWNEQQSSAVFCNDQLPDAMARTGEALVRLYMQQAAPSIQPASIEQPFQGVLGMVRIRGQVDIVDVDGTIIDIVIATSLPARIDTMHRFELRTCAIPPPSSGGDCRPLLSSAASLT